MQFVQEVPAKVRQGSKKWDEVAETLKSNVGSWGVLEVGVPVWKAQAARTNLEKRGSFEVTYRNGTVYAKAVS